MEPSGPLARKTRWRLPMRPGPPVLFHQRDVVVNEEEVVGVVLHLGLGQASQIPTQGAGHANVDCLVGQTREVQTSLGQAVHREEEPERDQEQPEEAPYRRAVESLRQHSTHHGAGQEAPRKSGGDGPVDMAESPVGDKGRDGQHGDHDQARAHRLTHAQPEYQEVERHEEKGAAVRQESREQSDARGRGDEQRTVLAASGTDLTGGVANRSYHAHTNDDEDYPRGYEQRGSSDRSREQ